MLSQLLMKASSAMHIQTLLLLITITMGICNGSGNSTCVHPVAFNAIVIMIVVGMNLMTKIITIVID